MLRRSIISIAGGMSLGAALRVFAQTQRMARIGVLANLPASEPASAGFWKTITDELKKLGWEEGRNLVIERRYGMNDAQKYLAGAQELVAAQVDVIYAPFDAALPAAFQATKSIPIVTITAAAVQLGYAKSLAHPGGNVTGVDYQILDYTGKQLELMMSLRPGIKSIGFSYPPGDAVYELGRKSWMAAASNKGVTIVPVPYIESMADIDAVLAVAKREGVQGLVIGIRPFLRGAGWQQIMAWAISNKVLPSGGTAARGEIPFAFGPDSSNIVPIVFGQIDSILRGAKPADMPIVQPTKFILVVNKKLASAMGLTIPQSVLLQATEVIE